MGVIDFGKLGGSDPAGTVLHPRELFTVLPKDSARYQYPRDVQAEVWDRWFERRSERDLVLKMNTGGGKTVVGLLILKSCLNENKGPAVYVTPDPYLTTQVVTEAGALGLQVTTDARDAVFLRGQAILVANIFKLINGQSVFGVGDEGRKIKIGSVVVDDAHACLATTEGQFTIRVDAPSDMYDSLFRLFRDDLQAQSITGVLDVEAQDPAKDMLVPYWAWSAKAEKVAAILHAERDSERLMFTWPLLKEVLQHCQCVIGGGSIEISSRCLPIDMIPSFASAERRIFMTATLADDSILVTHFDVAADAARAPVTPSRADDVGDRLILIPQELNPAFEDEDIRDLVARLAKKNNVVVIVPSHRRSQLWKSRADQVLDAKALPSGIERLKKDHIGLTVIVNKYDGIDLPDDACRILVLDGLPDVRSKLDRIEQGVLDGTREQAAALVQRIEQGMGRGVRSNTDYCVVLLMGRSLTHRLYANAAIEMLTPTTRAQFNLSQQLAGQLRGKSLKEVGKVIEVVLRRDREWTNASRGVLVGVKYESEGHVSPIALVQRAAFNAVRVGDSRHAVQVLQDEVNQERDPRMRGWLRQQLAELTNSLDPVESQVILRTAALENRFITRPLKGIDYQRLRTVDREQAPAAATYLARTYPDANTFVVETHGLLDALKFEPETAPAFERAFASIARLLGFESQRPEAEFGRGPDVFWEMGNLHYLTIECKNGATSQRVSKGDVNQLSGSMNWFNQNYDRTCASTPVMVHPSEVADRAASPHSDMRVMTTEKLESFKASVMEFANAIARGPWPPQANTVGDLLNHYGLTAAQFAQRFTVLMRSEK